MFKIKYFFAVALIAMPIAGVSEPAPQGCLEHFLGQEMPDVDAKHSDKTHVLCFTEYAVLHSGNTKTPLWSAEHLTQSRVNTAANLKRKNAFHAESQLPKDERAELSDYRQASGVFDRGHMSPSGDMSTEIGQHESFSLANMIPQNACNNEVLWETIESGVREFVSGGGELFVVTGPIFDGATQQSIGNGVLVPTRIFKAIFDPQQNKAAAYVVKNANVTEFETFSVAQIQVFTGIDVFPRLSAAVKESTMTLPAPTAPKFPCRLH